MTSERRDTSSDRMLRRDRLALLLTAGSIALVFAAGSAVQSVLIYELTASGTFNAADSLGTLGPRLTANLCAVLVFLLLIALLAPERHRGVSRLLRCLVIVLTSALLRAALQTLFRLYRNDHGRQTLSDFLAAIVALALCLVIGLVLVATERRLRQQELATVTQRLTASAALSALQAEELRVRRDIAEGLHGTLQQRLVLVAASVTELRERLDGGRLETDEAVRCLDGAIRDLDRIREHDVRELSQLLYPAGVDIGLIHAARLLVSRLPEQIAVRLTASDAVSALDDQSVGAAHVSRRILLMRVLEEAVSNALRHGQASRIEVALGVDDNGRVLVTIDDDGVGLPEHGAVPAPADEDANVRPHGVDPDGVHLHGMGLLRERVDAVGGSVSLRPGALGGVCVRVVVPMPATADA